MGIARAKFCAYWAYFKANDLPLPADKQALHFLEIVPGEIAVVGMAVVVENPCAICCVHVKSRVVR